MAIHYVILLSFAVLASVSALICSFLLVSLAKNQLGSENHKNTLYSHNIKSELDSLKTDVSRMNSEGVDHVLKKFKLLESDLHSAVAKVEALDSSIKNFYSKWARKLGQITKEENHDLQTTDYPNTLDFATAPEGMAHSENNRITKKRRFGH